MSAFVKMEPPIITDNPFKAIGTDWMLITAGEPQSYNTMTASWGGFGVLWNKNVVFCFLRPTRHTFSFIEKTDIFTLSFFDDRYRKALNFCGSHSGRDCDKAAETGLIPVQSENNAVYFQQARLVLECRKLYYQDIDPAHFSNPEIGEKNYPTKDYHRMYVGEVIQCLGKDIK